MLRHCSRLNCSVIPAVLFVAGLLVLFTAAHRTGVHQVALVTGITLAAAVALLMSAGLLLRARRPAAQPRVRQPGRSGQSPAARPAPDGQSGWMCVKGCGRPAETGVADGHLCRPCADWPAEAAVMQPDARPAWCSQCASRLAVTSRVSQPLCQSCADADDAAVADAAEYVLTQKPVLPPGETIGRIDMSEFEEGAQP